MRECTPNPRREIGTRRRASTVNRTRQKIEKVAHRALVAGRKKSREQESRADGGGAKETRVGRRCHSCVLQERHTLAQRKPRRQRPSGEKRKTLTLALLIRAGPQAEPKYRLESFKNKDSGRNQNLEHTRKISDLEPTQTRCKLEIFH
jgi:hypothetical protein